MDDVTLFMYVPLSREDCAMLIGIADNGNESFQAIPDVLVAEFEHSQIEIVWE